VTLSTGAFAVTSCVAIEFCGTLSALLEAVTCTRIDQPYAERGTVNELKIAPGMSKQLPVGDVHFFHWYEKVIGNEPVHVPFVAKRKSPISGADSPTGSVIVGYTVLVGGLTTPATVTTPVAAEAADGVEPAAFEAVTTTRNVPPTSAETTAYDALVAPPMVEHAPPDELHRCHRYVNVPEAPFHVPFEVVSNCPVCGEPPPKMKGADTAIGAAVCQSGVASAGLASTVDGVPQLPPELSVTVRKPIDASAYTSESPSGDQLGADSSSVEAGVTCVAVPPPEATT
jgi:hypothetical protein